MKLFTDLGNKVGDFFGLRDVANPLIDNNLTNRVNYRKCLQFGHLDYGDYYVLPQAHCRRCGGKTGYASKGVSEWELPRS